MPRINEPKVNKVNIGPYVYYCAHITICKKSYKKHFPYTEDGYKQGEEYIKKIKKLYTF